MYKKWRLLRPYIGCTAATITNLSRALMSSCEKFWTWPDGPLEQEGNTNAFYMSITGRYIAGMGAKTAPFRRALLAHAHLSTPLPGGCCHWRHLRPYLTHLPTSPRVSSSSCLSPRLDTHHLPVQEDGHHIGLGTTQTSTPHHSTCLLTQCQLWLSPFLLGARTL